MNGSKLDAHKEEILDMLDKKIPKVHIAKTFGVNPRSFHYWLNTRNLRYVTRLSHPLSERAEEITKDINALMTNDCYHCFAQAMEGLENEGVWLGNGHHAAQRMTAHVMETLAPLLRDAIHREVTR